MKCGECSQKREDFIECAYCGCALCPACGTEKGEVKLCQNCMESL